MRHRISYSARKPVSTLSALAEPSPKEIAQAADRLRLLATTGGDAVVEQAVVTDLGPRSCRVHLPVAASIVPSAGTGAEPDTLPGGTVAQVANVRLGDARTVGDALGERLGMVAAVGRLEFHSLQGDFVSGDITLPMAAMPDRVPLLLNSEGEEGGETVQNVDPGPVRVVTIARQHGTGGDILAQLVARDLGLYLVDREVFQQAADAAGASPEAIEANAHRPGLFDRMLRGLALGGGAVPSMWMPPLAVQASPLFTSPVYRDFVETAIHELAQEGGVLILGHGAQFVLRNRSDVFRVLITGGLERRAARTIAEGFPRREALQAIRRSDEERVAYFNTFYEAGWLDPSTYDLVINTDRVGLEAAAALVVDAVRMRVARAPRA